MTSIDIRPGLLDDPRVVAFLDAHLAEMRATSPPEAVFALDHAALAAPDVTFWGGWDGARIVSCGALREIDAHSAEIKSMRTHPDERGRGLASAMVDHILAEAGRRGYRRIYLETGSTAHFGAARRLYERHGFVTCGPFGGYEAHPHSHFMARSLDG